MPIKVYTVLAAREGNEDWAKETIDLGTIGSAQELSWLLDDLGWTVDAWKKLPGYEAALASGDYPWLADL